MYAGKPYLRGRLSTLDLLVLTGLDQLIFVLKILYKFFIKQATCTEPSPSVSIR